MLLISVGPGNLWRADRDSRNERAGVYWFLFVEYQVPSKCVSAIIFSGNDTVMWVYQRLMLKLLHQCLAQISLCLDYKNVQKILCMFLQKYWAAQLFSTLIIIKILSWAANQHNIMISEGSCDTEDWSIDTENSALASGINYILKYIKIEIGYIKFYNIIYLNIFKYFTILFLLHFFSIN